MSNGISDGGYGDFDYANAGYDVGTESYDSYESWSAPEAAAETASCADEPSYEPPAGASTPAPSGSAYAESECVPPWLSAYGLPANGEASSHQAAATPQAYAPPLEPTTRTVVVADGQGVLQALQSAGVPKDQLNAAYGLLVSSGQLRTADFVNGSPIVQPGREFELDTTRLSDRHARLGGGLIRQESGKRAFDDSERLITLTRPTVAQWQASPEYKVATDGLARPALVHQPAAAVTSAAPERIAPQIAKGFESVNEYWEQAKSRLRDDQGSILLKVANHVNGTQRDMALSVIDNGLSLGQVASHAVVSTYDSVRAGTLKQDVEATLAPVIDQIDAAKHLDTRRLSLSFDDVKVSIGTDGAILQYKNRADRESARPLSQASGIDEVVRIRLPWDTLQPKTELVLERNLGEIKFPWKPKVGGVPLEAKIAPGLRMNVTGSGEVTPSLNLDVGTKLPARSPGGKDHSLKLSLEWRQPGA